MRFDILSLFPEILEGYFSASIMSKAVEKGLISYSLVNIRDFAHDKHKTCDDYTFGGGYGMVLKPEPLGRALDSLDAHKKRVIFPTPSGRLLNQDLAIELSREDELVLICGRYEGIDQRIIDHYVSDEISVGDYVMSSGEIACLVIIDAIYRLIEGVINKESLGEESFNSHLLEYPHYTRPGEWRGMMVPEVLISGHHSRINDWRLYKSLEKTLRYRPDLLERAELAEKELKILKEIKEGEQDGSD